MIDPITEQLDEFYSLAWQDGKEGLNRRGELGKKFTEIVRGMIIENGKKCKEFQSKQITKRIEGIIAEFGHDAQSCLGIIGAELHGENEDHDY